MIGLTFAGYALSWLRTLQGLRRTGLNPRGAAHQALFLTLSKFPNLLGMLTYHLRRLRRTPMRIIEYNSSRPTEKH